MKALVAILGILMATILLSGCQPMQPRNVTMVAQEGPAPQKVVIAESPLLACYSYTQWGLKAPAIAVKDVTDLTGKGTYGDAGQGAMFPTNSAITLRAALGLAKSPANGLVVVSRDTQAMASMQAEATVGIRTPADQQKLTRPQVTIGGSISGADALYAAVHQIVLYGGGGGPSQQRYEVTVDLVLTDYVTGDDIYVSSITGQYVQNEMKLMFADIIGGGSGRTFLSAESETIVRSRLQGLVRRLVYAAAADILSTMRGSPKDCNTSTQRYITVKGLKPRAV